MVINVVDQYEEQEGPQHGPLGDPTHHSLFLREGIINPNTLGPVLQEGLQPPGQGPCHSQRLQLQAQEAMVDLVEGLAVVKIDGVHVGISLSCLQHVVVLAEQLADAAFL